MASREDGGGHYAVYLFSWVLTSESHTGVVDGSLRVHGTANLRVVDASIIPIQMACHTQQTVYAIAEKVGVISGGDFVRLFSSSRIGRRHDQESAH